MSTLESQANELGIPMQIVVDDDTRLEDCDAHAATLMEINNGKATYQGQCSVGHHYEMKYLVTDLQAEYSIQSEVGYDGSLGYGLGEDYDAKPLKEY